MQWRAGKVHDVVVGVKPKRDVVGNVEGAESPANDGFLIQGVSEADPWRKCLLVHRDVVLAGVSARCNQERIARTSGSRSATAGDGCIGRGRIPVGEPVVSV